LKLWDISKAGKIQSLTKIHAIGRVNPDADSIPAAMGYAWLLRERGEIPSRLRRCGG